MGYLRGETHRSRKQLWQDIEWAAEILWGLVYADDGQTYCLHIPTAMFWEILAIIYIKW